MIPDVRNITLVSGNRVQCQQVIDEIKKKIVDFEYYSYGDDVSIEFLEQELHGFSCFEEKKLFILNSYPIVKLKQSASKLLKDAFQNLPDNCYVILNNIDIRSDSLISFIKKVGQVYIFKKTILRKELNSFIADYFQDKNKSIDNNAVNLLSDFSSVMGDDYIKLDKLLLTLKKIDWYIGDRKKINQEDILNVCDYSDDFIIWGLFDFLDRRDYKGCLSILDKINNKEDKNYNFVNEINKLLYLMYWKYKLLLVVKEYKIKDYDEEKIISIVNKMHKLQRKENTTGYKTVLEIASKKNKSPTEYSDKMISIAIKGNYYTKPITSFYERETLYYIVKSIGSSFFKIRSGSQNDRHRILIIVKSIFMMICHLKSEKELGTMREVKDYRLSYFK